MEFNLNVNIIAQLFEVLSQASSIWSLDSWNFENQESGMNFIFL